MIDEIKCVDQVVTDQYAIYQGDSMEIIHAIPGDSIHLTLHSPPFSGLYRFSAFDRDLSNSDGSDFEAHYAFLIQELLRVTKPGRIACVHCMQLPRNKGRDGYVGMRDFRGEIIRLWQDCGWWFHSEVAIWKDPVVAQQRTKSLRLLRKQLLKDSTMSGQGLADYVVMFRKPGDNDAAITSACKDWIGDESLDLSIDAYRADIASRGGEASWDYEMWKTTLIWQRYASPVWMDIDQTRTLQYRGGRDKDDEVHISPLQLDVIERCIDLWSAPGETVLTPFLGIGSEVYGAVELGRKGIGIELKPSYFKQAVKNLAGVRRRTKEPEGLFEVA